MSESSANLPVGNRLQDQPFFHNVYALKREAKAMTPAAGAIIWTRSLTAEPGDLDPHISGTHLIDPSASPTGGAIVLACAVTLPRSIGRLRLSSRDPRAAPRIQYNFFADQNDLDRLVEVVRLSRRIGRTAPFSDLTDHEMAPGNAVDGGDQLRADIVSSVAAYLHPTSTVPMGADSDPTAVVDAWGEVRGVEALRVVDASILPEIPSVATNVATIIVAERIAARPTASGAVNETTDTLLEQRAINHGNALTLVCASRFEGECRTGQTAMSSPTSHTRRNVIVATTPTFTAENSPPSWSV